LCELCTEGRVEGTAIGYEGTSLGNISNKLHLGLLETISRLHPSDLVILEGVNKSVGLVHLLASLGSSVSQFLLLGNFTIVTLSELGLDGVDFVKLRLSFSKLGLSFS